MRKFSMRRLALFGVASQFALLGAVTAPTSAAAAPVEYVRVCDIYGTGFFYSPGTENCVDSRPFGFRVQTEWGTLRNSAGLVYGVGGFTGESTGNSAFGNGAWAGGDPNGDLPMPEPLDPSDPSYTYSDYIDQQVYDALGGIYPRTNTEITLAPPGDPSDPGYDPDYAAYYDSVGGVYTVIGAGSTRFPRSNFANMNTTAIGQGAQAGAGALGQDNATAVGQGATANALNATAIGQGAQANAENAVALGRGSVADVANTVSVGQVGSERRIVNVAAGAVTSTSTEAVVGSQLHNATSSVAAALGGGAGVDASGAWTGPSYSVQGQDYTDVGSALGALDTQVSTHTGALADLQVDVAVNAQGILDLEADVAAHDLAITELQTDVSDLQTDVSGLQTDVADLQTDVGAIQAGLADQGAAISGLENEVAAHDAAIADLETDVGTLQTDVAANTSAITDLETDVAANAADIADLETDVAANTADIADLESGATGIVRTGGAAGGLTVGAQTGGATVSFAGTDGDRRLTGVAAGVMGTDVVNVAQMEAAIAAASAASGSALGDAPTGLGGPEADGEGAYAAGYGSRAAGDSTTALGTGAQATFEGATAIGAGARATADPTTAVGFFAAATGNNASAFGGLAEASGENSTAIGESSVASATGATALGRGAVASAANSVALGAGSTATRGAQANYTALGLADPQTSAGEVSVGTASGARQITNVAAGSAPNDAVNVSQLAGVRAEAMAYADLHAVAFNQGLDRVMQRAEAGTAAALATAGLVQATEPGKSMVTAGVGTWRGESAVAFGLSHRFEGAWTVKAAGAYATEGGLGMNAAVGFEF